MKYRSGMLISASTIYFTNEVCSLAVFYLLSVTASGLSPILAYVLSLLNGREGLAGWRWIFVSLFLSQEKLRSDHGIYPR